MKQSTFINFFSIFLIGISFSMWSFLIPGFLEIKDVNSFNDEVKVRGLSTENKSEIVFDDKFIAVPNKRLFVENPEAPVRNQEYGDFYVGAHAAIAFDVNSGTILHYQEGKKRVAIASLTKVMTAALVVEKIKDLKNEIVTIDEEAVYTIGTKIGCPGTGNCTSTPLRIGEQVSAENLFKAMIMNSANDAAIALGNHIAGSQEVFASMMNDKAKELGLNDTHFCNPSGLDDDDNPGACYSTAYDYARIAAYSMDYPLIWDTMKIKEAEFTSVDGRISHRIGNTDKLLGQMSNCLGGKTGFTYEAGKSLMVAAYNPLNKENKVISVILNDDNRWQDTKKLFNWVFSAYKWPN